MDRRRDDGIAFFSFRTTEGGGGRDVHLITLLACPLPLPPPVTPHKGMTLALLLLFLSFFLLCPGGGEGGSLCAPHLRPSAGPQGHLATCTSLPRIRIRKRECPFRIPHNDPCAGCVCVCVWHSIFGKSVRVRATRRPPLFSPFLATDAPFPFPFWNERVSVSDTHTPLPLPPRFPNLDEVRKGGRALAATDTHAVRAPLLPPPSSSALLNKATTPHCPFPRNCDSRRPFPKLKCFFPPQNECPAAVTSRSCSGFRKPFSGSAAAAAAAHHHHHGGRRGGGGAASSSFGAGGFYRGGGGVSAAGGDSGGGGPFYGGTGCRARAFGRFWGEGGGGSKRYSSSSSGGGGGYYGGGDYSGGGGGRGGSSWSGGTRKPGGGVNAPGGVGTGRGGSRGGKAHFGGGHFSSHHHHHHGGGGIGACHVCPAHGNSPPQAKFGERQGQKFIF